jgi:acetyltransferase
MTAEGKTYKAHFLHRFFHPKSIAVVGASSNPMRIHHHLVANLIHLGFGGRIYPVHPKEQEILGMRAYASVKDLPERVDLVVIGISHALTPGIVKECIDQGIQRITIIAGGFSDAGEQGRRVQEQVAALVKNNGIRAIGPNALSPITVPEGLCISFHPVTSMKSGCLSLIFQSGLYEPRLHWLLSDFNLHINKLIDLGNKMDVHEVDALNYLVQDPETRVIGVHTESIEGGGRKFLHWIRQASRVGKRVVVLKSGRTQAGARAAASHTGALVQGSDLVFDGAVRQAGAIRVNSLEDFFDLTRALERFGSLSLKGNRIFLATFPGGEGVILTDLCEQEGLRLAQVSPSTCERLRSVFPPWDILANPWDLGLTTQFSHPGEVFQTIIEAATDDPNVDALAIQVHTTSMSLPKETLEVFQRPLRAQKPIVLWLAGMEPGRHENLQWLEERGVVVFSSPERALHALSVLYRLSRYDMGHGAQS